MTPDISRLPPAASSPPALAHPLSSEGLKLVQAMQREPNLNKSFDLLVELFTQTETSPVRFRPLSSSSVRLLNEVLTHEMTGGLGHSSMASKMQNGYGTRLNGYVAATDATWQQLNLLVQGHATPAVRTAWNLHFEAFKPTSGGTSFGGNSTSTSNTDLPPTPFPAVDSEAIFGTDKVDKAAAARIDPRISAAVNGLGFRLLSVLASNGETSVLSGASVATLMAMMTQGANHAEGAKILEGLGLTGMSVDEVVIGIRALTTELTTSKDGVQYAIANSVWGDSAKFPLDEAFVARVRENFDALAQTTTLASATAELNAWAEQATDGKITDIVTPELLADATFVAMNAIHFKGTWQTKFDPDQTMSNYAFTRADGTTTEVEMMFAPTIEGQMKEGNEYIAAKLPFGADGSSSLVVWVPHLGHSTNELVQKLATPEGQNELLNGFTGSSGEVYLPKFETQTDSDILAAFQKLGIEGAGPFSEVGGSSTSFDVIKQKAKLTVDENGAEGAAVTVAIGLESMVAPAPLLQADRPFVYAVLDEATRVVSFAGTFTGN